MKRILVVVIFLITLCGCNEEANVPTSLFNAALKAESLVMNQKSTVNDPGFWESAEAASSAIKWTIDGKRWFAIDTRIANADGDKFVVESNSFKLIGINKTFRDLVKNQYLYMLATNPQVEQALDDGKSPRVTASILRFTTTADLMGIDRRILSLCDVDGDGAWDYIFKGKACFTDDATAIIDEDGDTLSILD